MFANELALDTAQPLVMAVEVRDFSLLSSRIHLEDITKVIRLYVSFYIVHTK